jgi:DNA adenine methylase
MTLPMVLKIQMGLNCSLHEFLGSMASPAYTKLIRWAGSKLQIAKVIEKHMDFSLPYYEAFAGSAAIFFRNSPAIAHLNDANEDLINLYRDVSIFPDEVWEIYSQFQDTKEAYYLAREKYNSGVSGVERSALFLFLNHLCFNGIYRTNKSGKFNVPHGGRKQAKILRAQYNFLSETLNSAHLYSDDFETFFDKTKPVSSNVFLDPPYYAEGVRVFREYSATPFCSDDLKRLKRCAVNLMNRKNTVVITYLDTEQFRELFSDFIVESIDVSRNVGGFKNRRAAKAELIAVMK